MPADSDVLLLLAVLTLAVAAHVLLLGLRSWLNPVFPVAAAFLVLAPLSLAHELPHITLLKYARVYVSVLLVLLALLSRGRSRFRPAGLAFTLFVLFYWLAGLWSDQPLAALIHKGFFVATAFGGVAMATSIRSVRELHLALRCLALATGGFVVIVLLEMARDPAAISHVGRLAAFGMNPNTIGQAAALMFLVSFFVALHDRSRSWRVLGYGSAFLLAAIVVFTGSRASASMATIGGFILLWPLARRPGALFAVLVLLAATGATILYTLSARYDTERLVDLTTATRAESWQVALDHFREAPLFGKGWIYHELSAGYSTVNLLNVWLQLLAETGLMGFALALLAAAFVAVKTLKAMQRAQQEPKLRSAACLAVGLVAGVLVHGLFESSALLGSSLNALFLGLAIGLVDRVGDGSLEWLAAGTEPHASCEYEPLPSGR